MKVYQIVKRLGPYPFAHRQWRHEGHCRLIHGHNWRFDICITGPLDEKGFVYDFGHFKKLRQVLAELFDHTLVLSEDDPELDRFRKLAEDGLAKLVVLPGTSAEDLAAYIGQLAQQHLENLGEARIAWVRVWEDENDAAVCYL